MKTLFTLLVSFTWPFCLSGQSVTETFSNSRIKMEYQTVNGKLEGKYVSFYTNGIKRAEGNFQSNVRTGIWSVYDSAGRKIHQRNYTDHHLAYVKMYPEKEKTGAASLLDTAAYAPKKNKSGYIDYFPLKERMVIFSSRIWREITPAPNKFLFDKDLLYQTVFPYITDSLNESYCSKDENFSTKMSTNDLKKYTTKDYKIISWKIKEDFIYDIDRNVSETRIIGICPVGVNKQSKDTADLYWIYFPMVRETLSKVTTKIKNSKKEPLTLDDVFFFREFSSIILKQSNVNDAAISDYAKTDADVKKEQQRIEINLIEAEHEIWLGNLPY